MTSTTLPRFKSADGIAYHQSGDGIPVVLIHGVGLRSESWYQQIDALKQNFSVFAVDMPGHGESDLMPETEPKLYDFTEKLAKFIIDEVKQPAIIIGHSMGGLITLSLAKEYPELCLAIVPMNTIYKRSEVAKQAVHLRAEKLNNTTNISNENLCAPIPRWFNDVPSADEEYYAELCRQWLMSANVEGYAAAYKIFAFEDGPSTFSLSKLDMPALFITGELDLNSSISMTNAMAMIAPEAEAFIVNGARHMAPLTHADEINTVLLSFLDRRLLQTVSEKLG